MRHPHISPYALSWLLVILVSSSSRAATYYVSPSGSVTCSTNINSPGADIAANLGCLAPGDTLYLRGGTYTPANSMVYNTAATAGAPIVIAGYPGDARPVLHPPVSNVGPIFNLAPASPTTAYVTFKGFDMEAIDMPAESGCMTVFMEQVTLDDLECRNAARNAFLFGGLGSFGQWNTPGAWVKNTRAINCGRIQPFGDYDTKGLGFYTSGGPSIFENNIIDGCRAGGFEINYDPNINNIYRNNIIRNAGCASPWGCVDPNWSGGSNRETQPRGFTIGGGPTGNRIYNNILYNIIGTADVGQCFGFWGETGTGNANLILNNTCYHSSRWVWQGGGSLNTIVFQNNIFADMLGDPGMAGTLIGPVDHNLFNPSVSATFVNAPNGDFHLIGGSPAIDTGVSQAAYFTTDFAGLTRPVGSAWDLGAYEFGATSSPPAPTNLRLMSITP